MEEGDLTQGDTRVEGHVTVKAETRDAAVSQGAPGTPRTWKGQEGPPPGPSEGARPCRCAHCGLGESTFLLLEVAPLWTFVATAPGRVAARAHCGVGSGD